MSPLGHIQRCEPGQMGTAEGSRSSLLGEQHLLDRGSPEVEEKPAWLLGRERGLQVDVFMESTLTCDGEGETVGSDSQNQRLQEVGTN